MDWVESKSFCLLSPESVDGIVGCEAPKGFEPPCEVVGCDEAGQMCFELLMSFVEEALHGGFVDSAVHPFDLSVGPGMVRLGEAAIDFV